jgi:trans-AT polyketide synthase, acyltransferase and oxidoreductase domains
MSDRRGPIPAPTAALSGRWFPTLTTDGADGSRVPAHATAHLAGVLPRESISDLRSSFIVIEQSHGKCALAAGGAYQPFAAAGGYPVAGLLPVVDPRRMGDPAFLSDHGLTYPYVTGAMANGIASVEIVEAIGRAGMLGFFGAAGLSLERIAAAIDRLQASLGSTPFGINLIHSPNEQDHESATVDLLLSKGVRLVEASAFLDLTEHVVRYRLSGIHRDAAGNVVAPNRIVAKISRTEVASRFLSPPPERFVKSLVERGVLSAEQGELAKFIPMAQDITVEADSGGHTDNRPAITLLPGILALRERIQSQFHYPKPLRVGLGGGISTPESVAAAFAMGAAFVVTGSVNQACVESGSSDVVRQMLAEAAQADIAMAPAADMFEMGVKVQVLKRGTMFPMRASKLYELYRVYPSLEAIPEAERVPLEKNILRLPVDEVWRQTVEFFTRRDPAQISRAEADPKHKMALVFRWYLGQSSRWANAGVPDRKLDYQVWCGPAMGAFNEWVKGSPLESPKNRTVVAVALNLLYGAALAMRRQHLHSQGITGFDDVLPRGPWPLAELTQRLADEKRTPHGN